MGSAGLDGDSLFRPAGLRTLRQRYCKHTLLEARLDLVSIDVTRHLKGALSGAEAALTHGIAFLFLFSLFLLLALDR